LLAVDAFFVALDRHAGIGGHDNAARDVDGDD